MAASRKIFEQRMSQIDSIVTSQRGQLETVQNTVIELKKNSQDLSQRFKRTFSRQQSYLKRLDNCSQRLTGNWHNALCQFSMYIIDLEIHGVIPKADKEATKSMLDVEKRIASLKNLHESCKWRFEEFDKYSVEVGKEDSGEVEFSKCYVDTLKQILQQEDADINNLIVDIKNLMRI